MGGSGGLQGTHGNRALSMYIEPSGAAGVQPVPTVPVQIGPVGG